MSCTVFAASTAATPVTIAPTDLELDYVSHSPYRVPIGRLATTQAAANIKT